MDQYRRHGKRPLPSDHDASDQEIKTTQQRNFLVFGTAYSPPTLSDHTQTPKKEQTTSTFIHNQQDQSSHPIIQGTLSNYTYIYIIISLLINFLQYHSIIYISSIDHDISRSIRILLEIHMSR